MMKRIIATLAIVLSSGLLATPLVASASCGHEMTPTVHRGDLVQIPGRSTIFYIAEDGKRYNFPNAGVYQSWFGNDFSKVKLVSANQLAMTSMGGYVMYRPGTKLVKFATSPDVYTVGKNGEIRRLASPTVARQLFGANWNSKIVTLPANFAGALPMGMDIVTKSDYQAVSQSLPIEITFSPTLMMTVMR